MGVPKFFRYISERYPCLSEVVRDYQIPSFDNLYLDMNGIIHMCSHPDDADPHFRISEEKIFADIFHYIEVLFRMITPRKVFFMAIDGVAPRAKMNQQRGRRFCTAREMEMLEQKAKEKGETLPHQARFDSNCITPGTEFMARLHEQLKYFVVNKVSTDKMWRGCQIILSGQETPGEGEHKIMDYIRYSRAQPGYDPNTRHCLYGLDADLIMLGLCTHEPHFSLLREEVKFGKKSNSSKRKSTPETVTFYLLHLSLMREYLELEFFSLKDSLPFEYNIESIIDDWVLMGFLVGNDFIPHLPNLHIAKGAVTTLYSAYMKVLPTLDGYINESGSLNLERFEKFLAALSEFETEQFRDHLDDVKWFESKTGRRRFGKKDELQQNGIAENEDPKIIDLNEVLRAVDDIVLDEGGVATDDSCSEKSEDAHGALNSEFTEIKADYYRDKMEYTDVTPEVLRSLAEGYITAIQWNLHYYYNGLCSWSWYYPHHYAPCISDIKGFTDFIFDFQLGDPFKPYEQLLAVLPAASRTLLPVPFQELMIGDNSPIKHFYPQEFKTDMNGKRNDWEAVILIPFIDQEVLLKAMKSCSHRLTDEEDKRNRHGPMLIYKYTEQDMGGYEAPAYFPRVIRLHAVCQSKDYSDFRVPTEKLIKGAYPGVKMDVFYPGFPTMKHLKYTGALEFGEVRVFNYPSKDKSMILHIEPKEFPEIDFIAGELLGKTVFVGWPHLVEARVVSVSNKEYRYYSAGEEGQYNVEENKGKLLELWGMEKQAVVERYKNRHGIDLSETDHLVHVRTMIGRRYTFTPNGRVSYEKEWSKVQSAFPLQTVVANIKVYEDEHVACCNINEAFPVGSVCFMIGHPQYGSQGKVMESAEAMKNGRIKVAMMKQLEPNLSEVQQFERNFQMQYMPLSAAASRLSISKHIFSRITGSIFVTAGSNTAAASPTQEPRKINIGLNLKFNKKREEVPGYTQYDGVNWLYSSKTVALVHAFMDKFPSLFEYLQNSGGNDVFFEEDVFPNNTNQLKEVVAWLKEQPHYSLERLVSGSEFLELELVQKLEQVLELYNAQKHKVTNVIMQVKPSLLYKSEMQTGNIVPDETATYQLYDRVVNVRVGYSVPLGLKGTVVAINKSSSAKDEDTTYDVLFDETFLGGMKIHGCSKARGYRVPRPTLINISHGQRVFIHKTGKPGQLLNQATHSYQNGLPKPPVYPYHQPPQFQTWNPRPPQQQYVQQNWRCGNTVPPPIVQVPYNYPGFHVQLSQPNSFVPYKTSGYQAPSEVPGVGGVQQKQLQQPRNMFMPSFGMPPGQGPLSPQSPKKCNVKVLSNNSTNINVPSPSINNNTPNFSMQPSMPDTESLKKILKISDAENKDEVTRIARPTKPHVNSISVNDLFAHARAKEQTQQPANAGIQCATPATVRLWNYFQTINFGLPQYQYTELPCGSWKTQLKLPNGVCVYTDSASRTREAAAEKAAEKALEVLNIKVEPPNPPPRLCRIPSPPAPENKHERFTTPERRERQLVAQRHIFAHLGIRPKNTAEQPSTPQTPPHPNSNLNPNSSQFIPLQAMKPRSKPTLVQQKFQEKDIKVQSGRHCDSSSSKSAPQLQVTDLEVSDKPKRERKMRIAANFVNVP